MPNKVKIFKKPDGDLIFQIFNEDMSNLPEGTLDNFPVPRSCEGLPFTYKISCGSNNHNNSCCDIPSTDHIDKLHLSEDDELCNDHNWSINVIPFAHFSTLHREKCLKKIGEEFDKESPDQLIISQWQYEFELMKNFGREENVKMYQIALRELDARVAGGEPDKPVIRQKLIDKITELGG